MSDRPAAGTVPRCRLDDIEALRGWAILLVMLHHGLTNLFLWTAPWKTWWLAYIDGGTGVDLFFAISGFVIARSLLPRVERARGFAESTRMCLAFWTRRFWRLMPSAWLWLGVILWATRHFNEAGFFETWPVNREGALAALLLVANLRHAGVVLGTERLGPTSIYWSLSLEEQFYLLFPVVALLARGRLVFVLLSGLVLQSFWLSDLLLRNVLRTEAILLGVLLALWSRRASYSEWRPAFLVRPLPRTCTIGALLGLLVLARNLPPAPALAALGVVSAILVWIGSFDQGYVMGRGRARDLFIWIGERSYALYLIHLVAFRGTLEIWHRLTPPGVRLGPTYIRVLLLTAIPLLLLLASWNFRYVETPLRRWGAGLARRIEGVGPNAA